MVDSLWKNQNFYLLGRLIVERQAGFVRLKVRTYTLEYIPI